jgi:integrase
MTDALTGKRRKLKKSSGIRLDDPKGLEKAIAVGQKILEHFRNNANPNAPKRLKNFFESYLHDCELKGLSNSYLRQIRESFAIIIKKYGEDVLLTAVTPAMVRTFLFEVKSNSQAQVYYRCFHAAFQQAMMDGLIAENPFAKFDISALRRKQKPRPRGVLSPGQVKQIYDAMPQETYTDRLMASAFLFAFGTGMRRSEICYLLNDALDWDKCEINVRSTDDYKLKTKSSAGVLPMSSYAALALYAQIKNKEAYNTEAVRSSRFVFCNSRGQAYQPDSLSRWIIKRVRSVAKQLGIEFNSGTLHGMRRSLLQHLVDSGIEPITVSKFARHSNLSTTLSAYHKMADNKSKFESVLLIAGKMPLPESGIDLIDQSREVAMDAAAVRIIKHTIVFVKFKKVA